MTTEKQAPAATCRTCTKEAMVGLVHEIAAAHEDYADTHGADHPDKPFHVYISELETWRWDAIREWEKAECFCPVLPGGRGGGGRRSGSRRSASRRENERR